MSYVSDIAEAEEAIATAFNHIEFFDGIAWLGSMAFQSATDIVLRRGDVNAGFFSINQARLDCCLRMWESSIDHKRCDTTWPVNPMTFGQFQSSGNSALHVALVFSKSIQTAIAVARVYSLGMPKPAEISISDITTWHRATRDELEKHTLDLSAWPTVALRRDTDLILRCINRELRDVRSKEKLLPVDKLFEKVIGLWKGTNLSKPKIELQLLGTQGDGRSLVRSAMEYCINRYGKDSWPKRKSGAKSHNR